MLVTRLVQEGLNVTSTEVITRLRAKARVIIDMKLSQNVSALGVIWRDDSTVFIARHLVRHIITPTDSPQRPLALQLTYVTCLFRNTSAVSRTVTNKIK
jgi:hypothetical protein